MSLLDLEIIKLLKAQAFNLGQKIQCRKSSYAHLVKFPILSQSAKHGCSLGTNITSDHVNVKEDVLVSNSNSGLSDSLRLLELLTKVSTRQRLPGVKMEV